MKSGVVELDLADNGCGFWEILRFGAVAPDVGCDGFSECTARNINAHFVPTCPFADAAERAGVNAYFKGAGFEDFEVAIDPVGCVKPVLNYTSFANADLRSRLGRVQVRHAGDHGDGAIGLLESDLIDIGCAIEVEGNDRDIWIGTFGQAQC